jgi:hypothetical protein
MNDMVLSVLSLCLLMTKTFQISGKVISIPLGRYVIIIKGCMPEPNIVYSTS